MSFSDITFILQWWLMFFIIGLIFLPLTIRIFSNFFDRGYIFSKIIGMALISYVVFLLGILKIFPFTELTIVLTFVGFAILNFILIRRLLPIFTSKVAERTPSRWTLRIPWKIFLLEEILFLATLFFWSYIRTHQPDIHGLEKYMDFGFINSIIRSEYFPPVDMWFPPLSINYYYFGHLVTSVLTKLSGIPSSITYNLMLSTIFALTFTSAFSIGANLLEKFKVQSFDKLRIDPERSRTGQSSKFKVILAGLLTGFLVSMAGNLHAIYTFFKPYVNENPVPFWQLAFSFNTFPNSYWYPNATRFIHNTIHEFPIYSFVVSDLHGHFLDIPFVLFTIAALLNILISKYVNIPKLLLLSFLLAIMYMTNAWDGIIYSFLTAFVFLCLNLKIGSSKNSPSQAQGSRLKAQSYSVKLKVFSFELWFYALRFTLYACLIAIGFFLFSLPFSLSFRPFASGIGVLCAPEFLTNIGKLGPFLFEKDHCLRSPIWQLAILYGFFYFWVISFIIFLFKNSRFEARNSKQYQMTKIQNSKRFEHSDFENSNLSFDYAQDGELAEPFRISKFRFRISNPDVFILILVLLSTFLIIIPEFIYVKDIYPGHYRANTMFKLVYQAFIMLSIASGYSIVRIISKIKNQKSKMQIKNKIFNLYYVYLLFAILFLILVMIYPYFAINSYYNLKTHQGLDGIKYLKTQYPTDYEGILWINKNIKRQPVILEAQGDSYTDYGRVSANTGLPTVLGWTVHEWLWRGSYDIPSPRIPEVQKMYESEDLEETKSLLKKYKVGLVFFGDLERQKYINLNEEKFKKLGKAIYANGNTRIYKID